MRNIKISLVLMLAVLSSCSFSGNAQSGSGKVTDIQVQQFIELSEDSNTVVIDVRTPGEIAQGYIPQADLFMDVNGGNFEEAISQLDSSKTYIVYCRSGARSSRAANIMVGKGFGTVYNLVGGINAWPGEVKKD